MPTPNPAVKRHRAKAGSRSPWCRGVTEISPEETMLIRRFLLMLALACVDATAAERKQWEQLAQCRYVDMQYNDGDSFRVSCGGEEFVLRLYYVDVPEDRMTNAARVGEQRVYFGVTLENVLATGEIATKRVRELLQEPFVVSTRRAGGAGRSNERRYYGLVDVGGKPLIEILLAEGLARTKGVVVNLPGGEKSRVYLAKLRDLEHQAKDQRRGAWAHPKE